MAGGRRTRSPQALAVDLGGTQLRVARVDGAGAIVARERLDTPAERGPDAVVDAIVALLDAVYRSAPDDARVAAVGVAAPGPLDPRTGVVFATPNMSGWDHFPLAQRLGQRVDLPVHVQNDANLAAYGEACRGVGRGYDPFLYLTLSTGVGGGVIHGGRIWPGAHGLAGELGHVIVQAGGPACNFGHPGCLEALASGTGIARAARARMASGEASDVARLVEPDGQVTAERVAQAAFAGDAAAIAVFEEMGYFLGLAIAGFINAFDPARIALGGGVSRSWSLFAGPMWTAVHAVAMSWDQRPIDILPAGLGDDAGLVGAGLYALEAVGIGADEHAGDGADDDADDDVDDRANATDVS